MGKLGIKIDENTLIDTLYGGLAGQPPLPYITNNNSSFVTEEDVPNDSKQSQEFKITEKDIIPTHQVASATLELDPGIDIRPRFWDPLSRSWCLLDTGSQVSCCSPGPNDKPDPSLRLEAVDGSVLTCYGKKQGQFQIGRKTYNQPLFITNTMETILGMDFI